MGTLSTRCCIVGGGPAGMMLGFLLARGGVDVVVLEKHADFLRDFRGDTIHPSTLEVKADDLGAPMDVLWFRLPHHKDDAAESMGKFEAGHIFVLIDRGDYWQCAYVIPKGGIDEVHGAGLDVFRKRLAESIPMFADRVG